MGSKPTEHKAPFEEHIEIIGELATLLEARKALVLNKAKGRPPRVPPYTLQVDQLASGQDCFALGRALALTIRYHHGEEVGCIVGASQASIPMATIAAHYYALLCGTNTRWGLGSQVLDPSLEDGRHGLKTVIVADVLGSGQDVRNTISALILARVHVIGVVALIDILERTKNKLNSLEITRDTGVPCECCANIVELIHHLDPPVAAPVVLPPPPVQAPQTNLINWTPLGST